MVTKTLYMKDLQTYLTNWPASPQINAEGANSMCEGR